MKIKHLSVFAVVTVVYAVCPTPVGSDYVDTGTYQGYVYGSAWHTYASEPYCFTRQFGEPTDPYYWGVASNIQSAFDLWTSTNSASDISHVSFYFVNSCSAGDGGMFHVFTHSSAYAPDPTLVATTRFVYDGDPTGFPRPYIAGASTDFFMGGANVNPNGPDFPDFIRRYTLHEIGHSMGLGDQPRDPSQPCYGQTAGESVMNYGCGMNDSYVMIPTSPTLCDINTINSLAW